MGYLNDYISLSNGINIPKLGFGTWQIPQEELATILKDAIDVGYRLIDTSLDFLNEEGIKEGIKLANIKREELFITTKVFNSLKSKAEIKDALYNSLKNMDIKYFDAILISGVKNAKEPNILNAWSCLEELYEEGLVKVIGLANFSLYELKFIINNAKIKPQVCQYRTYIGHRQTAEINFCLENNIGVIAASPLGSGKLKRYPEIISMANKYEASFSQLALKYLIQQGLIPIPKTRHKERMLENSSLNFEISEEDMKQLDLFEETIW